MIYPKRIIVVGTSSEQSKLIESKAFEKLGLTIHHKEKTKHYDCIDYILNLPNHISIPEDEPLAFLYADILDILDYVYKGSACGKSDFVMPIEAKCRKYLYFTEFLTKDFIQEYLSAISDSKAE